VIDLFDDTATFYDLDAPARVTATRAHP